MLSREIFLHNLEVNKEDKERLEKFLKSKGLFIHNKIKSKIEAFANNDEKIKYTQIASTYRYDKRIRLILYKYISYYEEYLRSILLDNFDNNLNQVFWIKQIQEKLEVNIQLERILEDLSFRCLIGQIKKLPESIKSKLFLYQKHLNKNLNSVIVLRNAVMHNKFLLFYLGFGVCYLNKKPSGSTLRHNIYNLASFLPYDVAKSFINDIQGCQNDRNDSNDTKWDLPEQFLIDLNT